MSTRRKARRPKPARVESWDFASMTIRTVIVDDMSLAREAIRMKLQAEADVQIVAEAGSGLEAISAVRTLRPDLMFLDVQMPGLDGFQVLDSIGPVPVPSVIFVSGYDSYAVRAFQAKALHFLLKPIADDQFRDALQRARQALTNPSTAAPKRSRGYEFCADGPPNRPQNYILRFTVRDREGFFIVKTGDVDWAASAGNYTELHVGQRSYLIRIVLSELEQRLDPAAFVRISRSTIINIERVHRLNPLWHGDLQVLLRDGTELRMSRRYRKRLIS
jgi:two-component system LytT family response regulator